MSSGLCSIYAKQRETTMLMGLKGDAEIERNETLSRVTTVIRCTMEYATIGDQRSGAPYGNSSSTNNSSSSGSNMQVRTLPVRQADRATRFTTPRDRRLRCSCCRAS